MCIWARLGAAVSETYAPKKRSASYFNFMYTFSLGSPIMLMLKLTHTVILILILILMAPSTLGRAVGDAPSV